MTFDRMFQAAVDEMARNLKVAHEWRDKADVLRRVDDRDWDEIKRCEEVWRFWVDAVAHQRQLLRAMFGHMAEDTLETLAYEKVYDNGKPARADLFALRLRMWPQSELPTTL